MPGTRSTGNSNEWLGSHDLCCHLRLDPYDLIPDIPSGWGNRKKASKKRPVMSDSGKKQTLPV
jgi:hypothetical protein